MSEKLELGKALYELKQLNIEIDGKKVDFTLSGTYAEITIKYHELAKVFHPDNKSIRLWWRKSIRDNEKTNYSI